MSQTREVVDGHNLSVGNTIPSSEATLLTWIAGDWRQNTDPVTFATGLVGWGCTSGGTAGTWAAVYGSIGGPPTVGGITSLTTDVVAAGPGAAVATIQANVVTFAKMQDLTAASVLMGRGSASGAGDPQQITLGSGLTMTGTVLSASGSGGTVTAVTASTVLSSSGGTTPNITHNTSGATAGSYTNADITIDVYGHVTAAANGSAGGGGTVTAVTGSGAISSSGGTTPNITLNNTAVTPGSYTNTNLTVDAQGRITAASTGSGGGGGTVTAVTASSPLASSGGTAPNITHQTSGTSTGAFSFAQVTVDTYGHVTAIQNSVLGASTLAGRGSAGGTGAVEGIALGTGLSMSGTTLNASTAYSDVLASYQFTTMTFSSATGLWSASNLWMAAASDDGNDGTDALDERGYPFVAGINAGHVTFQVEVIDGDGAEVDSGTWTWTFTLMEGGVSSGITTTIVSGSGAQLSGGQYTTTFTDGERVGVKVSGAQTSGTSTTGALFAFVTVILRR